MKRKLTLAALLFMVLLAVYSAAAWWMLRGAGAYRMGTTMGSVLAGSWQYTALAALLLLLILAAPRLVRLLRRGPGKAPAQPAHEKKKRRKGTPAAQSGAVPPASGTAPMAQSCKIPPAAGTMPMPREDKVPPAPPAGATVPMPREGAIPPAAGTVPMPAEGTIPPAGGTVPMPQEDPIPPAGPAAPRICPGCGTPYEEGQAFCAQCGADLRGGRA